MKRLLCLLLLFSPLLITAQQVNNDIIPASPGLNMGHTNQRWNGFFTNVNISGTCLVAGIPCGSPTFTGGGANCFLSSPSGGPGALTCRSIQVADVPVLNQNTTGRSNTALALFAPGTPCGAGMAAGGVDASGNGINCFTPSGSFTPGSNLSGSSTLQTVQSIGSTTRLGSPLTVVDGTHVVNIAAAESYLNALGYTSSGTIWSLVPEDFTSDPFLNFHGHIVLGYQNSSGNTCTAVAPFTCYTTEVPLTMPTHLWVSGQENPSRSQGPFNSGTVINAGTSYPAPLGIPANASFWTGTGNHIPDFVCGTSPAGSLAAATYYLQVWEEMDRSGGIATSNATPGPSAPTYELPVVCGAGSSSIQYHAPTASGSGVFAGKAVVTSISPSAKPSVRGSSFGQAGALTSTGIFTQNVFCPGSASLIDPIYGCDMTSGLITIKSVPAGQTGISPPLVDISNALIYQGTGVPGNTNPGNSFGVKLDHITLNGAIGGTNTTIPAANEPSCALVGWMAEEQSGPDDVTFTGPFVGCELYSGYKGGNSSAHGLHMPSNDGPSPPTTGPLTLTAVNGTGVYTVSPTVAGCAANACAGYRFTITGFTNAGNNIINAQAVASSNASLDFSTTTTIETHAGSAAGPLFYPAIVHGGGISNGGIRELTDSTIAPRCSGCANQPTEPYSVWLTGTTVGLGAYDIHCENDVGGDCFYVDNLASLDAHNITGFADSGHAECHISATADIAHCMVSKDGKANAAIIDDGSGYSITPATNQGAEYANKGAFGSLTVGATATITSGAGAAAGNCTVGSIYLNTSAASASTVEYVCQPANTWTAITVP